MADFTIVIGNKKYSSGSLRGWMMLGHAGVPFDEFLDDGAYLNGLVS